MNPIRSILLFIILSAFYAVPADSQVLEINGDSIYNLPPHMSYVTDKTKSVTMDDLLAEEYIFKKTIKNVPVYATDYAYTWCKFVLKNNTGKPLYLHIHTSFIDTLFLYQVKENQVVKLSQVGDAFPFSYREIKINEPIFVLPADTNDSTTFYLRLSISLPRQFPITIANYQPAEKRITSSYFFHGLWYGLMIIMICYNLILWIKVRERLLIFYMGYLISMILTIGFFDGFAFEFLFPSSPVINNYPAVFPAISGILTLILMIAFLNLKYERKLLYKFALAFIFIYIVGIIWALAGYKYQSLDFVRAFIFIGSTYVIAVGYDSWRKGFKPAMYFMVGWCTFTTFVIIFILKEWGYIPHNFITAHSLKIGCVFQILFFAFAFGERISFFVERYTRTLEKYKAVQQKRKQLQKTLDHTVIEKVKEKTNEFREKDEFKNQMISIISHDLKSPINSLQMVLSLLDTKALTEAEAADMMDKIKLQIAESSQMMDNILEWSRNQLKGFVLNKKMHNVDQLIENIINTLEYAANEKNIHITHHATITQPCNIDEDILKLVLRNFLNNAIKFSPQNSEIQVSSKYDNSLVSITIKDKGVGIPADKIPLLFDYQQKYTTRGTSNEIGSGLGLKLASEFARKHDGDILVESEPGKGSSFTLTLSTW